MGRPRKPSQTQKGNITQLEKYKRKAEEESISVGKNQLARAPKWLIGDIAKEEWKRLIKELKDIEIIGNLDLNNLAGYCNAYENYRKATEELRDAPFCVTKITRNGETIVKNPLIDVQKTYAEEMRKFAALCGLTIDSRLKAAAAKTSKKEKIMEEKFGEI